ncbi:MAG: tryptophan synthase subunit alpha, partial [Oscillospiraceae bacterium]|nr:tryptophan synthase subunit alpha [Oscillospiraceae bacterium]
VTGVRSEITTDIGAMAELVRRSTDIPCAVGFGISTPEQAKKMAGLSDGAIVGSAIVRLIHESGPNAPEAVRDYVRSMTRDLR